MPHTPPPTVHPEGGGGGGQIVQFPGSYSGQELQERRDRRGETIAEELLRLVGGMSSEAQVDTIMWARARLRRDSR
jgi:hypothetical protein